MGTRTNATHGERCTGAAYAVLARQKRVDERRFVPPCVFNAEQPGADLKLRREWSVPNKAARGAGEEEGEKRARAPRPARTGRPRESR